MFQVITGPKCAIENKKANTVTLLIIFRHLLPPSIQWYKTNTYSFTIFFVSVSLLKKEGYWIIWIFFLCVNLKKYVTEHWDIRNVKIGMTNKSQIWHRVITIDSSKLWSHYIYIHIRKKWCQMSWADCSCGKNKPESRVKFWVKSLWIWLWLYKKMTGKAEYIYWVNRALKILMTLQSQE